MNDLGNIDSDPPTLRDENIANNLANNLEKILKILQKSSQKPLSR